MAEKSFTLWEFVYLITAAESSGDFFNRLDDEQSKAQAGFFKRGEHREWFFDFTKKYHRS